MSQPIRIQLCRRKGFRLADAAGNGLPTVKVDRSTKWGNPFAGGSKDICWRSAAVEAFRLWLRDRGADVAREAAAELRGKNLACWCPLPADGEPDHCHAAVLLQIANAEVTP